MSELSVFWQRISTQELYQSHSQYQCTTAHIKSSNHTLNLHSLTSCTLLYSSSLLLACFCRLVLLLRNCVHFYTDAARSRITENVSRDRYPASPLARWLDLQKTYVTCSLSSQFIGALAGFIENTSRDLYPLWRHREHTENTAPVFLAACVAGVT
jgi:hypothetical protein